MCITDLGVRRKGDEVHFSNKKGLLIISIQAVSTGNLKLSSKEIKCQPTPSLVRGQVMSSGDCKNMVPELLVHLVMSLK